MAISGDTFTGLGSAINDIFGGVGDFKTAGGYKAAAGAYRLAAGSYAAQGQEYGRAEQLSEGNSRIAFGSNYLQQVQGQRKINSVIGGLQADVAGSGLKMTGSALDILHDSISQGSLQMGIYRAQGAIEQQGYAEEQASYRAMQRASEASAAAAMGQAGQADAEAGAAKAKGAGGVINGVLKTVGTVASVFGLFSDARLKTEITFLDSDRGDGINHYIFRYRGAPQWYLGVLAQEVQLVHPEAVGVDERTGFMMVNYDAIHEQMYLLGSIC